VKAVVLAGGSGTRLWPLSRKGYPKQFLKLNGEKSLFQQTVERLLAVMEPADILVVTNSEYEFHIKTDLNALLGDETARSVNVIFEPQSRNTAPAIALGVKFLRDMSRVGRDEVIFIGPSDHVIRPTEDFVRFVQHSAAAAKKGYIVTYGIRPTRPETGYGYILKGEKLADADFDIYTVKGFKEKPDAALAEKYMTDGAHLWNSGMFLFTAGVIEEEYRRYAPEIAAIFDLTFDQALARFAAMPDISIDYAVMERSEKLVTLPLDIFWNDVGSWDALFEILDRDADGNAISGDVTAVDTDHTMIIGGKRLTAAIGLSDCLIVETDDVVLIARRGHTQKVKEVVEGLRKRGRKEVDEHVTTFRTWGNYTVLEVGQRYKIKRLVVEPLGSLSLQKHFHRSEHWVVVKGTARVVLGENVVMLHENESVYVPKSTLHRLENPGKVPLEIIEVQCGEYVGEDDIVRM